MAKKKKRKSRPRAPASPPRFTYRSAVRVKAGTPCPDMEDIPLGGWAGTVTDIDLSVSPAVYEITWSKETLAGAHEVYFRRCERDGMDVETCWLSESELEPDAGGPLAMEQPTALRPRPLDLRNPEERVLAVFGLTTDDDLPPITEENLRRYHEYLTQKVRFPFPALVVEPDEAHIDVTEVSVLRLTPVEEATLENGLFVEVRVGVETSSVPLFALGVTPNRAAYDDVMAYKLWFLESAEGEPSPADPGPFLLMVMLLLALSGAVIGAVLLAVPSAGQNMTVGAAILGGIGAFVVGGLEGAMRRWHQRPPGFVGGAAFGLFVGAAFGAALGGLVALYVGTLWGAGIGLALALLCRTLGMSRPGPAFSLIAGGFLGAIVHAFTVDTGQAFIGLTCGGVIGGFCAAFGIYAAGRYLAYAIPTKKDGDE
jgi:hypothetical protein